MPDDSRARLKHWLATGAARLEPLSFTQRELWEASAAPPADPSHHICTFMEVRTDVSDADCLAAMQRIVDRQEVLRLSILPGREAPLQLIRAEMPAAMTFHVLDDWSPAAREQRMRALFEQPFDLVRGPLYRVEVLRRAGTREMIFAMAMHHAISDGWTLGVFVEDLAAAYLHGALHLPGGLPAVPLSYSQWAAGERAAWTPGKLADRAAFWRARLADAPRLWKTAGISRQLVREIERLPAATTTAVRDLARRADATLFSTLLTLFQLALARWTGQTDLVVGTPVANRTRQSVRETMGSFAGVVPIRGRIDPGLSLDESVRSTHRGAVESFAEAMPFVELVRALGDAPSPDHNPVFDVRFALQNHPVPDVDAAGIAVKLHMRATGTARFDLGCEVTEMGDQLEVAWLHRPEQFSAGQVAELRDLFRTALTAVSPIATHVPA